MNLSGTQLKDTYGNLVTTGTSAGSPTTGGLQNGDGSLLTSIGIGTNSPATKLQIDDTSDFSVALSKRASTSSALKFTLSDPSSTDFSWKIEHDAQEDLNVYGYSADNLIISTNAEERMRIEGGGDISFRDTGGSEAFYWDASTARLGIGVTSPFGNLHIQDTVNTAWSSSLRATNWITIENTSTTSGSYSGIEMLAKGTGNSGAVNLVCVDSGSGSADFVISTRDNGTYSEKMRIDSSGQVGIGVSPDSVLHIKDDTSTVYDATAYQKDLLIERKNTSGNGQSAHLRFVVTGHEGSTTGDASIGAVQTANASSADLVFTTRDAGTRAERMRIDSNGDTTHIASYASSTTPFRVGYGTYASFTPTFLIDDTGAVGIDNTNPSDFYSGANNLVVGNNAGENGITIYTGASNTGYLLFSTGTSGNEQYRGQVRYDNSTDQLQFLTAGDLNARLIIDSSGNVLVGHTSAEGDSSGTTLYQNGQTVHKADGAYALELVRSTSDGDILTFRKDATTVGSIGTIAGYTYIGSTVGNDAYISFGADTVSPATSTGGGRDNAISLGSASYRFKDLYLGGNAYANGFYQNGSVTDNLVISQGTGTSRPSVGLWGNDHASFPGQVHIVSNSSNADANSGEIRFYDYTGSAFQINMTIDKSGNVDVAGALSKGSGSFKIDHPLESKKDTHHLVHSFVESPQANNIYRGSVDLIDGQATVNLDEVSGMTDGTFILLNTDIHVYTSNESDWDAVKGSVSDSVLTIECQNPSSTAKVNWLVIGERHDQHMIDTNWTDENGKVIVEPLKPIKNELEN